MPGNGGIRWVTRDPDDDPPPIKRVTRTPVKGEGELPKQSRGKNAADKPPPKGFLVGILKAEEANQEEKKAIKELDKKLNKKGGSGKLSKKELALAKKIGMEVKPSGSLVTGKDAPAKHKGGVVKGANVKGRKEAVEKVKEVTKNPWKLFK